MSAPAMRAAPIAALEPAPAAAAAPAVVRLAGVTKRFALRRSLGEALRHPLTHRYQESVRGVTLDVREGEFFGLLGPNGAGKTTLFKMLATLVTPDEGQIEVLGHDVVRAPGAVRRVLTPVIADERSLNWRLSARENLRLFAGLHGLAAREACRRADELLEVVGLAETGRKMVGLFSSGMRQRLLVARALLSQPRVLLLDEPTRSLDPISARVFRRFLREEIAQRQGCTILLATHTAEEAFELCDRVGVLDRGRLLAVGPARALADATGDERYAVLTRTPIHPAFDALERRALARVVARRAAESEGWARVELVIPGGPDAAAAATASLVRAGAEVAQVDREQVSLAEQIERVVAAPRAGGVA